MAKIKTKFTCGSCGYVTAKWLGRCPECGEWNTFEEELIEKEAKQRSVVNRRALGSKETPKKISEIETINYTRFKTKINEFDRVLGEGITKSSITLLGGEPGIGKSTSKKSSTTSFSFFDILKEL